MIYLRWALYLSFDCVRSHNTFTRIYKIISIAHGKQIFLNVNILLMAHTHRPNDTNYKIHFHFKRVMKTSKFIWSWCDALAFAQVERDFFSLQNRCLKKKIIWMFKFRLRRARRRRIRYKYLYRLSAICCDFYKFVFAHSMNSILDADFKIKNMYIYKNECVLIIWHFTSDEPANIYV